MKRLARKALLSSTVLLLILLALPASALADAGEEGNEFIQTVNGYQVALAFDKPAAVGNNQIHIRVNDAQNMLITDGEVGVSVVKDESGHVDENTGHSAHSQMADMPGMTGMSEQPAEVLPNGHAEMGMTVLAASHHGGEYTGEIAIETAGDCVVRVHLTVQGELMEIDFPLHVAQPQNGSGILAGFFAVNVAIIAGAVILKPKPISTKTSKDA